MRENKVLLQQKLAAPEAPPEKARSVTLENMDFHWKNWATRLENNGADARSVAQTLVLDGANLHGKGLQTQPWYPPQTQPGAVPRAPPIRSRRGAPSQQKGRARALESEDTQSR